jgi:hypothetical protein
MIRFLDILGGFILGLIAMLGVVVTYNTYQIKNKAHMETRIKEFNLKKIELVGYKTQSFRLTGEDGHDRITIDVKEMPIGQKKFVVHFDSYMLPNGEVVRYSVFKCYK